MLQTWNSYFVWDDSHKLFLKNYITNKANIFISGPILFGKTINKSRLNFNYISVFDIQSYIDEHYKILGVSEEYHIPDIAIQFLKDIKSISTKYNLKFIYKRM